MDTEFKFDLSRDDLDTVKAKLEQNPTWLNKQDRWNGLTPLMEALMSTVGTRVAKFLIEKGADLNIVSKNGDTALLLARHFETIKLLVEKGVDVNVKNKQNETPLFKAIQREDAKSVKFLIENGANVNEEGKAILLLPILRKKLDIVKLLVENGAKLETKSRDDMTALDYAVIYKEAEIAKYLLEKGAILSLKSIQRIVSENYNIEFVKLLIERVANVDAKYTESGVTALMYAAKYGRVEVAKLLIEKGANVNLQGDRGETPLIMGIDAGSIEMVSLLIEKGANLEIAENTNGTTPLIEAVLTSSLPILKLLVEKGANLDKQDNDGNTALIAAAANDEEAPELIKFLLEKGAKKDIKNNDGQTAYDVAQVEEIKQLLALGDIKPELFKGFTKSDVDLFNTIFEKPSDISLCPVCLDYTERKDGCMYMFHKCTRPHPNLYKLYSYKNKSGQAGVEWCTLCGRPSKDHHHYMYAEPESKTLPGFAPVQPTTTGEFRFFDKDCKASGGGGNEEKIRRFNRMLHYACELQSEVGKISEKEGREELIEETWKGANLRQRNVPKILEQKKFDFPCEFPADKLEASVEEVYPDVKKPEGFQPNPIKHDTDGDRDCTVELGEHDDHRPVYQFIHKQPDGTTIDHKDEYICVPDLINGIKASEINGKCPITAECKGKIYPEELKDIVPAEFYETYRKLFNKANAVKTGGGGNFFTHVGDDALCAMPPKKAGKRRKTYRKKKMVKRTRKH